MEGPPGREEPGIHDDRCVQRIRVLRLAEAGDPPSPPIELLHTIAAEIQSCCGHVPLRAYRFAYGWTVAGAIRALHSRCASDGAGHPGVSKRAWQDWEAGKRPNRHNQDLLCRLFATGPVELGFARDYRHDASAGPAAMGILALAGQAAHSPHPPGAPSSMSELPARSARPGHQEVQWDMVMSAAHESSEHAAAVESASVGPNALEQIGEDVLRIARAYVHARPLPLLGELIPVRDRAYWLLDRTRNPSQQRDLYLIAGQACGLLASASFDLGYPHAAAQQARAARAYGEIIDGKELSAWADGMLAIIEMWAGRPRHRSGRNLRGQALVHRGACRRDPR
jgi:hypothetical protein